MQAKFMQNISISCLTYQIIVKFCLLKTQGRTTVREWIISPKLNRMLKQFPNPMIIVNLNNS